MPYKDIEKQREFNRKWIAMRRQNFFSGKVCVKCGSNDKLELDHIERGDKITNNIWSWCESRRNEEIKKCQVLCHECHLEKTKEEWRELWISKRYCKNGHDLLIVGFYISNRKSGQSKYCKQCHKITKYKNRDK